MKRTITVSKTRPDDWPEGTETGTHQTTFGPLTITEKGISTTAYTGPPPVRMTAKKKHRRD